LSLQTLTQSPHIHHYTVTIRYNDIQGFASLRKRSRKNIRVQELNSSLLDVVLGLLLERPGFIRD
jgi:hypothetical protein